MKEQLLDSLANENNGYLFTSQAEKQGISCKEVMKYVSKKHFEKMANGLYISSDILVDYLCNCL